MKHKKLRFAVIGAGRIGGHHARILGHHPDAELVGVCDPNIWRAQVTAWRTGALAYRDYHQVLDRIDAAVVAVPTDKHHEVSLAAMSKGIHCLIEKPLASSLAQAKEILAACEKNGVVLQVGHVERFNPAVLKALEFIRHPRFVTVERLGPYDPRVADIGVVMDLMIHDLDILLTLVGSEIEDIEAVGASLFSKHEDIANVRVRFKSGCIADLTASRISLKKHRKIRIFQESSYISLDYASASLKVCRKKNPVLKTLADVDVHEPKLPKVEPLRSEIDHFIECIRHGRKPWPSGEHGMEALKLALQITDELEKYEVTGHQQVRAFLPSWVGGIGKIAQTVSKSVLGE
ncbi:MAG TPA: UDP-N-acetyl-D-glucosamine dehydrogenase [Elusimicrobia bacterium]|nr:UDP-N-acetyl-D-glucosamine dehydrogenase [Elusimicrobiota bacterium]